MFNFDYSILSCFKNKWDQVKKPENVWECVREGVQATVSSLFTTATTLLIASLSVALVVNSFNPTVLKANDQSFDVTEKTSLFYRTIEGPIREEFLVRLIIQNGIYGVQEAVKRILPSKIQKNRIFEWLASPGFRALSSSAIFAGGHLRNAGGYLSSQQTALQVLRILAMPLESILFERTRPALEVKGITDLGKHVFFPFIASCAAHITNNTIVFAPLLGSAVVVGYLRSRVLAFQKEFVASSVSLNPSNSIKDIPEGCRFS